MEQEDDLPPSFLKIGQMFWEDLEKGNPEMKKEEIKETIDRYSGNGFENLLIRTESGYLKFNWDYINRTKKKPENTPIIEKKLSKATTVQLSLFL